MKEIIKMLNELNADELDSVIVRANIMLEKKRKEEAERALLEKERLRQEKIEQERKRQQEIAELQRKLQELQSQKPDIPEPVEGDNFVMHEPSASAAAPVQPQPDSSPEPTQPQPAQISCPHCHQLNEAGSRFCANCGQKITDEKVAPSLQTTTAPQSAKNAVQVRYADESMKEWEMLPGEKIMRGHHEIILLQPNGGKFAYYMEVTNRRILFTRESSGGKNAALMARMGGGLVGSLIAEGVKSATGAGPKPWLEIPLAAVSSCGVQNKKEFFIVADQTYVLKNKNYEKFLPDLIANSKR